MSSEIFGILFKWSWNASQCATANPDGHSRALVVGGGIANFTDVAATFNGIIRALKEKVSILLYLIS